jgi:MoaA/NifB/PqqE/SkfB family radical SAM enzyme
MSLTEKSFYDFPNGKLTLSLTTSCNLRCVMCPVIHNNKPRSLKREQALDAARLGAERGFGMIELSGGEPFLLPYVREAIELACGGARLVTVTTNAALLKKEDVEFLARFSNLQIQVSFDGLADAHDAIRGKQGAFAASDAAVRALAEKGVKISLNTVVQRQNAHQLYEIYEYFSDLPYEWHGITPYEPGSANLDQVRIAPEQGPTLRTALARIQEASVAAGKPVALSDDLISAFEERIAVRDAQGGYAHPGLLCTVPRRAVFVMANGSVTPCIHLAWSKYLPMAKRQLSAASLADIIDGDEYKNMIRRATGIGGCPGCSTMCYNFDSFFRRKMMNPNWYDSLLFDAARGWEEKKRAGRKRG